MLETDEAPTGVSPSPHAAAVLAHGSCASPRGSKRPALRAARPHQSSQLKFGVEGATKPGNNDAGSFGDRPHNKFIKSP